MAARSEIPSEINLSERNGEIDRFETKQKDEEGDYLNALAKDGDISKPAMLSNFNTSSESLVKRMIEELWEGYQNAPEEQKPEIFERIQNLLEKSSSFDQYENQNKANVEYLAASRRISLIKSYLGLFFAIVALITGLFLLIQGISEAYGIILLSSGLAGSGISVAKILEMAKSLFASQN